MQRANIKEGPPTPPSLARPETHAPRHHSSPPFPRLLLLPPLLPFFSYAFVSSPLFSIFVRGAAFAQQTRGKEGGGGEREREREKQGQDRLPGMQKQEGMSSNRVHFLPFFQSFYEGTKAGPRPPHEGYNNVQLPLLSRRLRDSRLGEGSRGGFGINAC